MIPPSPTAACSEPGDKLITLMVRHASRIAALIVVLLPELIAVQAARANALGDKPLTIVVPFPAGGPTDTVGRIVGQALGQALGLRVMIENVGGAGGTLGAARVARATPDGHSLLLHHVGHTTAPALYRKLSYDPVADFAPIGLINEVPMTFIARKDFPPKDFRELIAHVKANRDKITYANAGLGSASHLCGTLFLSAIATDVTTVPYKGTAPAMNDLLGGQVDFLCDQTTNTTGQIKAGKVKAYAVTSRRALASLPNLPTADAGGLPGFDVSIWHGLWAPRGTPAAVVDRIAVALRKALAEPAVKKRFADLGAESVAEARVNPASLGEHQAAEVKRWAQVLKKAGAYAD